MCQLILKCLSIFFSCDHLRLFEVDQPYHTATEKNYFASAEGSVYESISSGVVIQHCMSNSSSMSGKRFYIQFEVVGT